MTMECDEKNLRRLIEEQSADIMHMLLIYDVPDSVDNINDENFLITSNKKNASKPTNDASASIDELQERLSTIKNKLRQKKRPTNERAQKKRELKKLKKNKQIKKMLTTVDKSIDGDSEKLFNDSKKDIKRIKPKPIYNAEGKIVFSKFDFAAHPGAKQKKPHQNPREILKKIKETDKKIKDLKEQGENEKAAEIRNKLHWQKAFDKVEGKKVKDDPKLLYKAIKKRKVEKKKSKTVWAERKQRVEQDIEKRQKKRQENLDKRSKDKKTKKLKNAAKRGRIIPGF